MGKKGKREKGSAKESSEIPTTARQARIKTKKELKKRRRKRNNDEDDALFRQQLDADNLRVEVMEGDGNCVFRSLSDQLHGDDSAHVEMRAAIVQFEKDKHEHFEQFVEDEEPWGDYLARMGRDGEWGGNMEIVAASMLYEVHVVVHQLSAPRFEIRCHGAMQTVHLSYHGEAHYNSVRCVADAGVGRVPAGLPQVVSDDDGPTLEEELSRVAPWAPVAAVRAAVAAALDRDDALELLVNHRAKGTLDTFGVSGNDSEMEDKRRRSHIARGHSTSESENTQRPEIAASKQLTRSGPCRCGSGRPYKRCCRPVDLKKARQTGAGAPLPPPPLSRSKLDRNFASVESVPATMASLGALRI